MEHNREYSTRLCRGIVTVLLHPMRYTRSARYDSGIVTLLGSDEPRYPAKGQVLYHYQNKSHSLFDRKSSPIELKSLGNLTEIRLHRQGPELHNAVRDLLLFYGVNRFMSAWRDSQSREATLHHCHTEHSECISSSGVGLSIWHNALLWYSDCCAS